MHIRELTAGERRAVRRFVKANCANYDADYGCLMLDGPCYMFGKVYTGGAICKWFCNCLMPADPNIGRLFDNGASGAHGRTAYIPPNTKPCALCGRDFPVNGRQAYCSEACAKEYRRKYIAQSVREYRKRRREGTHGEM